MWTDSELVSIKKVSLMHGVIRSRTGLDWVPWHRPWVMAFNLMFRQHWQNIGTYEGSPQLKMWE